MNKREFLKTTLQVAICLAFPLSVNAEDNIVVIKTRGVSFEPNDLFKIGDDDRIYKAGKVFIGEIEVAEITDFSYSSF